MRTARHGADRMRKRAAAFIADESGATAMEYALIATLISVAIIGGATAAGSSLNLMWTTLANNTNPNLSH